ncbi:MAG TPA: class I SAM-dependent methyltransferase [Gemmatimonadaceae bacterium]|nr:class I SAM-dependent methyltransferase [Gemmatimonadaceae bacterium]
MPALPLPPAARAFDAVAASFDERYGAWRSVDAQRRAVRAVLLRAFPRGAHVLEIGGGTGEDARWLARHGRTVQLTDASPSMIRVAAAKLRPHTLPAPLVLPAEGLAQLAEARQAAGETPFDGAFSNFAALNCVADLAPVGQALARLVRPGGQLVLVLFGPCPPGEVVVQLARREPRAALRRLARGDVPARLGGREFTVRYHRPGQVTRALAPWFQPVARRGIGVFVPPSAAEPWISHHPRILQVMEALDRVASRPLALLGDHLLFQLERTRVPAEGR